MLHQRLGAVMPGADGDAIAVKNLSNIMGMSAFEAEGKHSALARCFAMNPQAIDAAKPLYGMTIQDHLMIMHCV